MSAYKKFCLVIVFFFVWMPPKHAIGRQEESSLPPASHGGINLLHVSAKDVVGYRLLHTVAGLTETKLVIGSGLLINRISFDGASTEVLPVVEKIIATENLRILPVASIGVVVSACRFDAARPNVSKMKSLPEQNTAFHLQATEYLKLLDTMSQYTGLTIESKIGPRLLSLTVGFDSWNAILSSLIVAEGDDSFHVRSKEVRPSYIVKVNRNNCTSNNLTLPVPSIPEPCIPKQRRGLPPNYSPMNCYALKDLSLKGYVTVRKNRQPQSYALIEAPDRMLYAVSAGQYIGSNANQIVDIGPRGIVVKAASGDTSDQDPVQLVSDRAILIDYDGNRTVSERTPDTSDIK